MKKLRLFIVLCTTGLIFTQCVDDKYEFSKGVDTDNITLGSGGYVVPLGDIQISLSQFIQGSTAPTTKAMQTYTFAPYDELISIDAGFDESIINSLTDQGELKLKATISNLGVFNFNIALNVAFYDGKNDSAPTAIINEPSLDTSKPEITLSTTIITKEMLTKIAKATYVRIKLGATDGQTKTFNFDINSNNMIQIHLVVLKTGGIKP